MLLGVQESPDKRTGFTFNAESSIRVITAFARSMVELNVGMVAVWSEGVLEFIFMNFGDFRLGRSERLARIVSVVNGVVSFYVIGVPKVFRPVKWHPSNALSASLGLLFGVVKELVMACFIEKSND